MERVACLISPVPLQYEQVVYPLPDLAPVPLQAGQCLYFLTFKVFSIPSAISSRVSFRFIFKSEPYIPRERPRLEDEPPKKSSKILPLLPNPPNISLK
jgi:hypothetical protein